MGGLGWWRIRGLAGERISCILGVGLGRIGRRRTYSFVGSSCGHDEHDMDWTGMLLVLGRV